LLFHPGVIVANVPYHMARNGALDRPPADAASLRRT
jgi:hypothetical protein